ncbi:uncharacterized protein LOC107851631 isoform X3 [Capsicum annuum]|uniref:uncharacterized protein LOC107851631 isoform X3 n=1 Tax=Capsicum annuum TaxID=4072 RepID=UPI001FB0E9BC|nr:uncharacterized protein LOC107851631 isoform X3 [Capsicum annuum]XP_047256980.1 uncharacterized protein LOC107851631 isoform X3 [Capsicum annuum]XP_047256981.1 uncharacterized protein LOC107851631 isoform X3 [Capsicum annuum]
MESSTSPQLWWLVTQPCQNIGGLRRYFSSLYSLDFLIESEFGKRVPLLFLVTTCLFLFNLGQAKVQLNNLPIEEATRETKPDMHNKYPHLFDDSGNRFLSL